MFGMKPSVHFFFSLKVLACERSEGRRRQTEPPVLNSPSSPSSHPVNGILSNASSDCYRSDPDFNELGSWS